MQDRRQECREPRFRLTPAAVRLAQAIVRHSPPDERDPWIELIARAGLDRSSPSRRMIIRFTDSEDLRSGVKMLTNAGLEPRSGDAPLTVSVRTSRRGRVARS